MYKYRKILYLVCLILLLLLLFLFKNINVNIKNNYDTKNNKDIRIYTIIPHHNLVDIEIDNYYSYLKWKYNDFDNIFIISPNHFSMENYLGFKENKEYCYKDNCIKWRYLDLSLLWNEKIYYQDKEIIEHWIWNHFKFINKYFNHSKVYSIWLKINTNEDFFLKELEWIINNLNLQGSTLFIWSVDFSHHVNEKIAVFHDMKTIDFLNWLPWNIEVDCPNCLYLMRNIANNENKKYFNLFDRSSVDLKLSINSNFSNTTHIYWEFENKKQEELLDVFSWSYNVSKFDNPLPWYENEVYIMSFWDIHFTRWFTYKSNPLKIEDYLRCFYSNSDLSRKPEFWHNRIFYSFDFVWVNLETSIAKNDECTKSDKSIVFRTEPNYLDNFKEIGINLYNLSNNHSYDCWDLWFQATKKYLDEKWLFYFWDGRKTEENILKKDINWTKVAFIWFNDVDLKIDIKEKVKKIETLTQEWYIVIVNVHWGSEYKLKANDRQREFARKFVDAWAKIVIWHHPHVVQDYEEYKGVPIFYSLWNFIFDQPFEDTLVWYWLVFSINWQWIKYNLLNFKRDSKSYLIDCTTLY